MSCNCHSAPNLFRQFLFANHIPNYLAVPLYQGDKAKAWAKDNLPEAFAYIENRASFVLIVGWSAADNAEWADINNANPERQMKAELILERFAQLKSS